MPIHYTTFVMPGAVMGMPHDTPFFVLGAEFKEELGSIPAVTSLHRIENQMMPYSHASMVLGEVPVSDLWATTSTEQYDGRAKVVILRDPVPHDVDTKYAELTEGVLGPDLPPWLGLMLAGEIRSYSRDVPVTVGRDFADVMSIGIDPSAPTTFPAWAHQVIPPGS
ncbi:hypothetical protein SAMN05216483_6801 [Streptomyces sp. 2131.1]|uniref:hypothetical protein n=1 Tax=Streptomyces sp. 2131.1 TaxID=1855346 RepID=UPI00089CE98A|nr:hypothetical protein [Streptomyces sp. 2131.1]SEE85380.1 hypothetical protein SAMN05216483_6801 [Streptomyces sp. 2131.1]